MKLATSLASLLAATLATACAVGPTVDQTSRAMMAVAVTDAPVEAASGVLKASDIVARHTIRAMGGAILLADVEGSVRPVPAGTPLAEGIAASSNGPVSIFCDVREIGRWSTSSTDCFQDADGDGQFDTLWQARTQISYFMLSLSTAGMAGPMPPAAFREATEAERPTSQIGFKTFICWNGQPAFLLAVPVYESDWKYGTGPCGAGDHPGEISTDGVFRGSGVGIKVTGEGDARTFEVVERVKPGPIMLGEIAFR